MNNKYLRYCLVEPKCRIRLGVIIVMIALIAWQMWYRKAQAAKLTELQQRSAVIASIPKLEKDLKTRAQLEAFRNEQGDATGSVTFTKISGIAMQDGKPSVLIDETVYAEGDAYGDYIVEKITAEMITLVNQKTKARKNLYVFE